MRKALLNSRTEDQRNLLRQASLASTSPEQFDAAWQLGTTIRDEPAREVLERLLADMGLCLPNRHDLDLDKPVSLNSPHISKLQAIEEVGRQIRAYPQYPPLPTRSGGIAFYLLGKLRT